MGTTVCSKAPSSTQVFELVFVLFSSPELTDLIYSWFKEERIRLKIGMLNADGFAAMGYPRTGREEVLVLSKLIAWVSRVVLLLPIIVIDCNSSSRGMTVLGNHSSLHQLIKVSLAIDDAAMLQQPADVIRYRDETIQLVEESLLSVREEPSRPSSNPAIQSFWDIGTSIRSRGNPGSAKVHPNAG